MARHKNNDWGLPVQAQDWTQVAVAVLMDIRDELMQLNRVFACPNFQAIPRKLDRIRMAVRSTDKRLAVRIPLRKGRSK